MKNISRRRLLKQATGGAALLYTLKLPPSIRAQTAQSPEDPTERIRESFDFGWRFNRGDTAGAQNPGFSDSGWKTVDLPHDWSIEGPFSEKAPSGGAGGYLPSGIGWYRKSFSLPASYKERKILIEFDGVYENSEVWINGHWLGLRPFGYIPFAYDVTPHLAFGRENVVAVKVDNSRQPNCRWYSGSGIYRHTWLLATNKLHVGYWGTFVLVPHLSGEAATVQVKTAVENDDEAAAACTIICSIMDRK
jgi:beta-galactosidase